MRRRDFVAATASGLAGLAALAAGGAGARAKGAKRKAPPAMLTRPIPRTKEALPVIGMGTWQTFDVGAGAAERAPLTEVLTTFFAAGATVIDSSPMYGRAEEVVGDLVAGLPTKPAPRPFLATKVWTSGKAEGERQIARSMKRLRTERLDLLQVHNLLDTRTHLATMRALREAGKVRYLGITHYQLSAFDELERLLGEEQLDFVQLPYSVVVREAEKRLLPAAAATGTAVLVMRPFEGGELFAKVKGKALPPLAAELDCTSWAQLFLKFLLGHPAVTCPIPATSKAKHLVDNLGAGRGRLPDEQQRAAIAKLVDSL